MVTIFHISDLHIVTSARWNNLRDCVLQEARAIEGEKLLVVTGDFHNFWEGDYAKAEAFLKELITALGVEPDKDVFVVPGNHDVGSPAAMKPFFKDDSWEYRQESETEWLKNHNSADKNYKRHVAARLEAYTPYCDFVRRLGVYPNDAGLTPAGVHVRTWRGRLNLLHLNTTLVYDKRETPERLDILTATSRAIWSGMDESLPALALGHNSYYDLDAQQQTALKYPFREHRVCAYLCGDTHAEETDANRQHIRLDYGYTAEVDTIPNMVCVKGAADENDKFSDFGLYLHEWDEQAGYASLRLLRWTPEQGFKREDSGGYTVPHRSPDDRQRELERLREELKKKDGAPPPETPREERARGLWSAGKSDEALALLDSPNEKLNEQVQQAISEKLLAIDILKSKQPSPEVFRQIRACYEECVKLAKAHEVSVYVVYDYASFLDDQNDYTPAIDAARWLLDYYERKNEPEEQRAKLQNLMGILFYKSNSFPEAEEQYREALGKYSRLAEGKPTAYEPDIAETCNNLGSLLKDTNRMVEAEEQYCKALEIRRRLAKANPAAYELGVANTSNNLGELYRVCNQMDKAEPLLWKALEIRSRLAERNPTKYEPHVFDVCINLGNLFYTTNRMEKAEEFYCMSLEITLRLAEINPAAYEPYVAMICNNLGNLLRDTNQMDKAESFFQKALALYRKLAEVNSSAYEPCIARICNNLGELYRVWNREKEAETFFLEALSIRRRLAKENPSAYELYIGMICNNLGELYRAWNRENEAETYYHEALTIHRHLAEENHSAYDPNVATTCFNLGLLLLQDAKRKTEAKPLFEEAARLWDKYPHFAERAEHAHLMIILCDLGIVL